MNRAMRSAAVWAALAVGALAADPSAAGNLLANGGFEDWPAAQALPTAWQFVVGQDPAVVRPETGRPHGGSMAVRLELTEAWNTAWLGQRLEGIRPDTEYRISGHLRLQPGFDRAIPLNVEPNLDGFHLPAKADEWTYWEGTFNSREATQVMPQFRIRGTGTVWLDDIRLEAASEPGARVLPERAEMLRLLAYQADPVPADTNTAAWTQALARPEAPEATFTPGTVGGPPPWRVGQWVRYLCEDDLVVPSARPEKRRHIAVVDCAVVGQETLEGRAWFWYQSTVRLDRYWVAKAQGRYDSGGKVLLATPRQAVLSLLVDGPEFRTVRRYQLKVDDEPLLEYTDGQSAVLPALDLAHALIRPATAEPAAAGQVTAREVPVTGLLALELRSPHLDRTARLIHWGTDAADGRGAAPPVVVRLPRPPYIGVSFDGFGTVEQVREIVSAGAGVLENQVGFYLGENRPFYHRLPAFFSNSRAWDVDLFDVCRSNFRGFSPHLDEPYQRQRKPNEYLKRGDVGTLAEAADRYTEALRNQLEALRFWPGHRVYSYDSPASAAWYDLRAGADGFILENARLASELAEIRRVTGREQAMTLAVAINAACLAGAARRFGTWWGQGIYRWVPEEHWREATLAYVKHGARYVGFWLERVAGAPDEMAFYKAVVRALPDLANAVREATPAVPARPVALVVPYGSVLGLAGSVPGQPWGVLDVPENAALTDALIRRAAELVDAGTRFEVVVDDPRFPPAWGEYAAVIRLP